MAKIKRSELEIAEKKYQAFIEKREELNALAENVAKERDTLHDQKKKLIEEMKELKSKKDSLVQEMRKHKELRNELQKKAKEFSDKRRERGKKVYASVKEELEATKAEVQMLEMKQQTVPLTLQAENDLLDLIKRRKEDMKRLEKVAEEQGNILGDIKDLSGQIDELRKKADEEHEHVILLASKIQEYRDRIVKLVNDIAHLIAEANKKHEQFLKVKETATSQHLKAMEMREKVIVSRKEKWREREEARKILVEHRAEVKKALDDKEKLDKAADEAVKELFKKGKVVVR